jgi:uncharacterized protein (UPF0332 family)
MDWCGYFELAQELASGEREAHRRSSISRAYYAAYGCAQRWLTEHERFSPSRGDSHLQVWQAFGRPSDKGLRLGSGADRVRNRINVIGSRLKHERVKADYDASVAASPQKVGHCLDEAKKILTSIEELYRRLNSPET